jgi:hypothetical protein
MIGHPTRRVLLLAGCGRDSRTACDRRGRPAAHLLRRRGWRPLKPGHRDLRRRNASTGLYRRRNVTIDYLLRSVDLSSEALTEAIAAQIGRGGEVIVAYGPERTLKSAVAATRSIPIVMAAIDYDPLAKGYIARTRRRSRRNERLRRSRSSSSAAATRSQRVSSPA